MAILRKVSNDYDSLSKEFVSEKYVVAHSLREHVHWYKPFSLDEIVERFIDPCNPGDRMTLLPCVSDPQGAHKIEFDRLFLVLVPLDKDGKTCAIALVNIEIQRKFYIQRQSNIVRVMCYAARQLDDARGRLADQMRDLAETIRRKRPGLTILPERDNLYDPYHPCYAFWFFMYPPKKLMDTVTPVALPRNLMAKWAPMDRLGVEAYQGHLVCAGHQEGHPWTTSGNMIYALLSPEVSEEDRVSILEDVFQFKRLDFIREKGAEFMSAAGLLIENTWKKAEKKYGAELDGVTKKLDGVTKKLDGVTKELDGVTRERDVMAHMIAETVIHSMLETGHSFEEAVRTEHVPQEVVPSIWEEVSNICGRNPDLAAQLTPLL